MPLVRRQEDARATDSNHRATLRAMTNAMPYPGNDFYCDVAIPNIDNLDVIEDTASVLAYRHTRPFWAVHIVVVPKAHIESFTTVAEVDEPVVRELLAVVQRIAGGVESSHGAARINTNLGTYQDSKHLHIHVSSGDRLR